MSELTINTIERNIYFIRGQKVMLDSDLAKLYKVETRVLKQAVKRNLDNFPADFMFKPNNQELADLRSQFVTSNDPSYWNHTHVIPSLFTENGVAMLSTVLKSRDAIQVNIAIMRIFTRLRSYLLLESELRKDMKDLKVETGKLFKIVFERMDEVENEIRPKIDPKRNKIGLK